MLCDEQVFRMAMKKLTAEGNRDAVEDYLLSEFWRLEEGDIAVADSCCCGKSACRLEEEDIAWQRNRLQGQIIVGSELADFYRENKAVCRIRRYTAGSGSTAPMRCWTTAKKNRRWS